MGQKTEVLLGRGECACVGFGTDICGVVDVVEFVHATTAGGALLVGVAVTLVVALALRSVTISIPSGRASVALVLTLGGLAAVAYAVQQ